jgi:hypothetical protein
MSPYREERDGRRFPEPALPDDVSEAIAAVALRAEVEAIAEVRPQARERIGACRRDPAGCAAAR